MDKLIEKYKEDLKNDDNNGYDYPVGLKNKILEELNTNNFTIPAKIVNEMLKIARIEGV